MSESPPNKKKRLSLSLKRKSACEERFLICSTEELKIASKKAVPKNTTTAVNWVFRVLRDWLGVVTDAEEEELWRSGVMGCETPQALQNAVFYLCGIYLCLRGRKTNSNEEWKPLKELSLKKSTSGSCSRDEEKKGTTETDTTQIPDMMKHFSFNAVHGCTFNFKFVSK